MYFPLSKRNNNPKNIQKSEGKTGERSTAERNLKVGQRAMETPGINYPRVLHYDFVLFHLVTVAEKGLSCLGHRCNPFQRLSTILHEPNMRIHSKKLRFSPTRDI